MVIWAGAFPREKTLSPIQLKMTDFLGAAIFHTIASKPQRPGDGAGLRQIENGRCDNPVVAPSTVLSHWERKLSQHVPGLKAAVYHGGARDMDEALKKAKILLTTYGVLRRDIERLRAVFFTLAVFDEVQYLKNPETQAFQCAREINAGMKLGLTGTPIENRLQELKALLDLTVPGYLGKDSRFCSRYLEPVEKHLEGARTEELRRLISPVTLRRRKETVLRDLPPKIEDVRTCRPRGSALSA